MITYTRTANAGGILEMDGVRILLDGVSQAVNDYLATPPELLNTLYDTHLDMIAFTHNHSDHFQPEFVRSYVKHHPLPKLIGPKDVAADLSDYAVITASSSVGAVQLIAVPSRHMGAEYTDTPHYSFLIRGSSLVWFMGDASPLQWKGQDHFPHPDVLIAPYAYASTEAAWEITEQITQGKILLTHLPDKERDSAQLWPAVEKVLEQHGRFRVRIPRMGDVCEVY